MQFSLARRSPARMRFSEKQRRTLLASARLEVAKDDKDMPPLRQSWQAEAYDYYPRLGACRYPAQLSGQMLSRVRLFVGVRDASGEVEESEDERELELLEPLADQDGGHSTLLRRYGQHMFIAGECSLVNTLDPDDLERERYELLSPLEFRKKPDGAGYVRQEYPGKTVEYAKADDVPLDQPPPEGAARVWRLWRPDPAFSGLADSPVRSVLGLYEEMAYLAAGARSRVLNRLIRSGILFYAGEINFPNSSPDNPDEDPEADDFFSRLIEHITAAISDPGSASAIAPLLARVDTGGRPISELIHWLTFGDNTETYPETQRQQEVLKQIALGIDWPADVLTGVADMNHWNGWLVQEENWSTHGDPLMISLVGDLTAAFLRPYALALKLPRAGELVIGYDPAAVVNDPDRTATIQQAYKDGVVSAETYREAIDLSDEDAMTPEERAEWLAIQLHDPNRITVEGLPAPTAEQSGQEPAAGPPAEATPAPEVTASGNGHLAAAIQGAAAITLHRARELAGSRILTRKDSCPDCFAGSAETPTAQLAAKLGPDVLREIKAPPAIRLVSGSEKTFISVLGDLGVAPARAETLGVRLLEYAAETLCEQSPRIPPELCELLD